MKTDYFQKFFSSNSAKSSNLMIIIFLLIIFNSNFIFCTTQTSGFIPSPRFDPKLKQSETTTTTTAENKSGTKQISCPETPRIDITSYNRPGFQPSEKYNSEVIYLNARTRNIVSTQFAAKIILQCVSKYPIEWTFDGPFVSYSSCMIV